MNKFVKLQDEYILEDNEDFNVVLKILVDSSGIEYKKISEILGYPQSQYLHQILRNQKKNGSLKFKDFVNIMKIFGYQICIKKAPGTSE